MKTKNLKLVNIILILVLVLSLLNSGCGSALSDPQSGVRTQVRGQTQAQGQLTSQGQPSSQTQGQSPSKGLPSSQTQCQSSDKLNVGTPLKPVPDQTAQTQTQTQTQPLQGLQSQANSQKGLQPLQGSQVQPQAQSPEQIQSLLKAFKSITETLGADPRTERNFTWMTSAAVKTGVVEYCEKNSFQGFGKPNVTKLTARSYVTGTDSDKRAVHKAQLKNLKPGTEYIYRIGSDTGGFSPQGTFKTAEQALDKFTFINITDTQGGSSRDYAIWKNTLDKALGRFPDARFLVHTGDMVDVGQDILQWDMFTRAAQPELLNLPILPAIGNHEGINKNGTNNDFKNFTDRFDLPGMQNTGAPPGTVYSLDYGNVHIAVMNTQCGSSNLKKQADWLKADMKSSDKPWKIVALHRGPYGATYDTTDIRRAWAPAFDEAGIDLVLEGHDHNYMRSYPMKNNKAVDTGKGTVYMVSNTGGVKFYPEAKRSWQAVDMQPRLQMYIAVTVSDTKMVIEAYDINDTLRDSVTLSK